MCTQYWFMYAAVMLLSFTSSALELSRRAIWAAVATIPGAAASKEAADVRSRVRVLVESRPELAGKLLRLAFHDAVRRDGTLGGPNGSIRYELDERANVGLGEAVTLVEEIRGELSLADAIAVAGAAAVEAAGGPAISIPLGRLDATRADPRYLRRKIGASTDDERDIVCHTLPSPGLSTVGLRRFFRRLDFDDAEIVALLGAHTLGRHVSLINMSKPCLRNLTRECLETAPVRLPFVASSPDAFDASYFRELIRWEDRTISLGAAAFIPTDVALVLDPLFFSWVRAFANDEVRFFATFATAYRKLVAPLPHSRVWWPQPVPNERRPRSCG